MAIKRPTLRVSPGPAQRELFGGAQPPPAPLPEAAPRTSFVDPSPEALTIGPQSLRSYLASSGSKGVFGLRDLLRGLDYGPFLARYEAKGRTPYHPALMVGLTLFAVLKGVRSLRGIEAFARENVTAWWLTGGACPDHASIGRFVNRFGDLLGEYVFEQVTSEVLRATGTSGTDLAGDGTTIPSVASRFKVIQEDAARERAASLRAEAKDRGTAGGQLSKRLEQQAEKYERAAEATQRERKRTGRRPVKHSIKVAVNDPESTVQRLKNGYPAPSYKPTVLANEARIVVACDVQSSSENEAIDGLLTQAKRVNGGETIETVRLDAGFCSGEVLETLLKHEVENPLVTESSVDGQLRGPKAKRKFAKAEFDYDKEADTYRCPAGETLKLVRNRRVRKTKIYGGAPCQSCPLKDQCTRSKKGREIYRYEQLDPLKTAMRRVMENPLAQADYSRRSSMVEPVFADIRQRNRFYRFLRVGLKKVRIESAIVFTAHNLGRFLAILAQELLLAFLAVSALLGTGSARSRPRVAQFAPARAS